MCGIARIISGKHKAEKLQEMLKFQQHRGPDHTAEYVDPGKKTVSRP